VTKSRRNQIIITAAFLTLIGFIIYSTMGLARVNCEVCMEYQGRASCRPAYGVDRNEALGTAIRVACADIAFGREDSIACTELTAPKTTRCSE